MPAIRAIHRTIYDAVSAPSALNMHAWHRCSTTHCRAGWAITLAGKAGAALEDRYGPVLAAMMIYDASTPPDYRINPCRFFDTNEAAMEDMRRLADADADAIPEGAPS